MTTPLIDRFSALGVLLAQHGHCLVPVRFADLAAECQAAATAVALLDASDRGWIEVAGGDRVRFLNGMTTNDVHRLRPGQGCAATMVSAQGKLIADLAVLALEDRLLVTCRADQRAAILKTLAAFIVADDVTLTDWTAEWGALDLIGPGAGLVLHDLAGGWPAPAEEFAHATAACAGHEVRVIRSSPVWGPGYQLVFPVAAAPALWDALMVHGARHGLRPIGLEALNVLRIEAGVPWFGADMDEAVLPVEAGLEARTISYTKGCYVGQEVIARIKTYGEPAKRLFGLRLAGTRLPAARDPVRDGAQEVGWVTSAVVSPGLGPIALAYLRRGQGRPGARYAVATADGAVDCEVVDLPFVPPPWTCNTRVV